MKWKNKDYGWHRWFAWYPISIYADTYWLVVVERKVRDRLIFTEYEYRLPTQPPKENRPL